MGIKQLIKDREILHQQIETLAYDTENRRYEVSPAAENAHEIGRLYMLIRLPVVLLVLGGFILIKEFFMRYSED